MVAIAMASLVLLSACGSIGVLNVGLAFTGEVPVKGSYVAAIPLGETSCTDFASNGVLDREFVLPTPDAQPLGGHRVDFLIDVSGDSGFHGPATYTSSKALGFLAVDSTRFDPKGRRVVTVIRADGSGSLTFNELRDVRGAGSESGTFTWTCS
jgi:hypothetical protein